MKSRRQVLLTAGVLVTVSLRAADALPMPDGGRPWRIGWLNGAAGPDDLGVKATVDVVVGALRAKGWQRQLHYVLEMRFAGGDPHGIAALADELIRWHPDVLYGLETAAVTLASKTRTIPIVMATSIDPVAAGLVRSLAAPGTNVTGMTGQGAEVVVKQVELLNELVPNARRIALLFDRLGPGSAEALRYAEQAAQAKGLTLMQAPVTDSASVGSNVRRMQAEHVGGVVLFPSPRVQRLAGDIGFELQGARLPIVGGGAVVHPDLVRVADYGQDFADQFRQSADYIDRILRGAKPADLPVRQATRFVLSVNVNAARELGITVPAMILLRADKVIE